MIDLHQIHDSIASTPSRIVLLVADGLGGLAHPETGRSELETARIPNLDALAQRSACGLTTPVEIGVAPGSGPGHLALFGYDPLRYYIGRGVLEALGIGVELRPGDVAARGNFATVDDSGRLTDRRAGRIATELSRPLCEMLDTIEVAGAQLDVYPVQDYRFVLRLRGDGLSADVEETDPQREGAPPNPARARAATAAAERTAAIVREFVDRAGRMLAESEPANMALLRGWAQLPNLPDFGAVYRLNPAAIAAYPMYRGLASVAKMQVIPTGMTFGEEVATLRAHWDNHDFFFIHYKPADAAGEDGDFEGKVRRLEELDEHIPAILELQPEVLMVAGDHATPAVMAAHSWHPVPFLLHSALTRGEGVAGFNERACALGALGRMPATAIMLLALSHAGKLGKYGP